MNTSSRELESLDSQFRTLSIMFARAMHGVIPLILCPCDSCVTLLLSYLRCPVLCKMITTARPQFDTVFVSITLARHQLLKGGKSEQHIELKQRGGPRARNGEDKDS